MKKERNYKYLLENYTYALLELSLEVDKKLDYFMEKKSISVNNFIEISEESDAFAQVYKIFYFFKNNLMDVLNLIDTISEDYLSAFADKYDVVSNHYTKSFNDAISLNKLNIQKLSENIERDKKIEVNTDMDYEQFKRSLEEIKELIVIYNGIAMSFSKNLDDDDYDFPSLFKTFFKNSLNVSINSINLKFNLTKFHIIEQKINNTLFYIKGDYLKFEDFKNQEKSLFN